MKNVLFGIKFRARSFKLWTSITVIVVFVATVLINQSFLLKHDNWFVLRENFMMQYFNHSQISRSNSNACILPSLNAFSSDILHFMKTRSMTCSITRYGRITKEGWFLLQPLNNDHISALKVYYIYRHNPYYSYINEDFAIKLSEPISLKRNDEGKKFYCIYKTRF